MRQNVELPTLGLLHDQVLRPVRVPLGHLVALCLGRRHAEQLFVRVFTPAVPVEAAGR